MYEVLNVLVKCNVAWLMSKSREQSVMNVDSLCNLKHVETTRPNNKLLIIRALFKDTY